MNETLKFLKTQIGSWNWCPRGRRTKPRLFSSGKWVGNAIVIAIFKVIARL